MGHDLPVFHSSRKGNHCSGKAACVISLQTSKDEATPLAWESEAIRDRRLLVLKSHPVILSQ